MKPARVVIIEDEPEIRESLAELLEYEGYPTLAFENGLVGLRYFEESTEDPCVILLDLMMPVMNGWEFLTRFRALGRAAPVVVVSAVSETPEVGDIEAQAFLRKPIDFDVLLATVQSFCA